MTENRRAMSNAGLFAIRLGRGQPRPMTETELRIRCAGDRRGDAADWDACANPVMPSASALEQHAKPSHEDSFRISDSSKINRGYVYNPFISHAFLSSLEDSKSVGGRSGWQPQHLLAETPDGALARVPHPAT